MRELREMIDDLYDMISTPTRDMSKQYLLINAKIDELISGSNRYVSVLDPFDEDQVNELMGEDI